MYGTKNLSIIILILLPCFSIAQNNNKESVYLIFDTNTNEKCIVEDGSGNSEELNAFRKEFQGNLIFFHVFNESFLHNTKSKKSKSISLDDLDNLKRVDINYMVHKKSKNVMKYNPFEKIYIVEKKSDGSYTKYEVTWIDDWTMIRD
jgi:hypothetical protein